MRRYLILSTTLLFVGCAQHHCRRGPDTELPKAISPSASAEDPGVAPKGTNQRRVMVYKYDGSLQCKQGQAVPVEAMAKELQGLSVFSQSKKPDGLMHIQVCGSATGMANVYEISETDLPKAEKLGFKKWTFE